jgi:hypothetical protein
MGWMNAMEATRTVSRFLVLPKRLNGRWKWMKRARIVQAFVEVWKMPPEQLCYLSMEWRDVDWAP